MNIQDIAKGLGIDGEYDAPVTGFAIDSRKVVSGNVFIALAGENTDGHEYAGDAERNGAVAVLGSHAISGLSIPVLIVPDVVQAMGTIAEQHRATFSIPFIALTGSNGKTTVKEMIAAILPQPSLATQGNLNNHLGVPLNLLRLNTAHQYAVFELGANHKGEIAYTASLVKPDVALINNIAPAHIGEFGSIEQIADAKGEIYQALSTSGVAVINDDDAFAHYWDDLLSSRRQLRFSQAHPADVYAKAVSFDQNQCASFLLCTPDWEKQVVLNIPGKHMVSNALAAATCCYAAGIHAEAIVQGLSQFKGVPGRQTFREGINQATLIDDTYNANLRSVLAAIEVLAARPGKRILVLGDMGELGAYAQEHHQQVGQTAKEKKVNSVLTCGHYTQGTTQAFGSGAQHFPTLEALIDALKPLLDDSTTVLVKGSRSARMERVVSALLASNA